MWKVNSFRVLKYGKCSLSMLTFRVIQVRNTESMTEFVNTSVKNATKFEFFLSGDKKSHATVPLGFDYPPTQGKKLPGQ